MCRYTIDKVYLKDPDTGEVVTKFRIAPEDGKVMGYFDTYTKAEKHIVAILEGKK